MGNSVLIFEKDRFCVCRDLRCWHAGTPNLSEEVRAIPGCGFAAPWLSSSVFGSEYGGILTQEVYDSLSPGGRCGNVIFCAPFYTQKRMFAKTGES